VAHHSGPQRAVDRLRVSGRLAAAPIEFAEPMADPTPDAATVLEIADEEQRLTFCLGTLDGGDAALIRTAFFQGATYAELATRTATLLGTIKSRIRRALLKLRDCLA
jgi:DNA-directed RNA polymerase specialized sigma24 family protein